MNKYFLFVAILSLLNIGGRILYNLSYSNTEIEYIKNSIFFNRALSGSLYLKNSDALFNVGAKFIKATWSNAIFMYLYFTIGCLYIPYIKFYQNEYWKWQETEAIIGYALNENEPNFSEDEFNAIIQNSTERISKKPLWT